VAIEDSFERHLAVQLDVDRNSVGVVEVAATNETIGDRPALIASPRLETGNELALVDQAVLKRNQAEEEVARCVESRRLDCQLPMGTSQCPSGL
jgi:hypothetical protein